MVKKNLLFGISTIFLVICIAIAVVGYFSSGFQDWDWRNEEEFIKDPQFVLLDSNQMIESVGVVGPVRFLFDGEPGNSISKNITVVFDPVTAEELVDWSVAWAEGNIFGDGKTVTDYITVTPSSDGAKTAVVICKAVFEGNIIISVVSRFSEISGSCIVRYVGVPTSYTITPGTTYGLIGTDIHKIGFGSNTFSYAATNGLGPISSTFNTLTTISLSGQGTITYYESNLGSSHSFTFPMATIASIPDFFSYTTNSSNKTISFNVGSIETAIKNYINSENPGMCGDVTITNYTSDACFVLNCGYYSEGVSAGGSIKYRGVLGLVSVSLPGIDF